MTTGGWIVMLASVGFVTGLLAWCVYKVATAPARVEHIRSRSDIDTRDDAT